MFNGYCFNQGDVKDVNLKVYLSFGSSSIDSFKLDNEDRIQILNGGKPTSNFVEFLIEELLPDERQSFTIWVKGNDYPSVKAWSEKTGNLNRIYIYNVIISPE